MPAWWQNAVFYQIYPRSFKDTNGDGVGDLRGITEKLDYLKWLGVDVLWLSPIFKSPMVDFGYDVADYTAIDPLFGSLEDFDHLLNEVHQRGLRLILDLVPNHTSDQHEWFLESRSSRDNPKRDWYMWADAKPDGSAPNNLVSYFGGKAWTWDAQTNQYYLHNFAPEQPELNWRNMEVKAEMFDQIRFWLRRGVDGFRIDVIDRLIKDPQLRDNPTDPLWQEGGNPAWQFYRKYSENYEGIHDLIAEMRAVFDEFEDRVMVGELAYSTDPHFMAAFAGSAEKPEIHLPFNFALLMLPWNATAIRHFVETYDSYLPVSGTNYVLGNHDQPRLATRFGNQARNAALMLMTLRGAAFIYQGEELGMVDGDVHPDQFQDPQGKNTGFSRDPCRTPFHWNGGANAGFSEAAPWLPVASGFHEFNVEAERQDEGSTLTFYRQMIALRRDHPELLEGRFHSLEAGEKVFAYTREHANGRFFVALNFTGDSQTVNLGSGYGEIEISAGMDRQGRLDLGAVTLRAHEGILLSVEST
jgi:alpha-glucosidase